MENFTINIPEMKKDSSLIIDRKSKIFTKSSAFLWAFLALCGENTGQCYPRTEISSFSKLMS